MLAAPESKVARRAQLCASHWVQGSPLPPAAQAIILSLALLDWLFLQPAALVALISRGRDSLVLTVRHPRVAGDVPQVGQVALESALTAQNFVDRTRAPIHAAVLVHRVQFFEQVLHL